jgi:hypothetical protein
MKSVLRAPVLLAVSVLLLGCEGWITDPEEDEDTTPAPSTATGSYNYSFSCPSGTRPTIPIPNRLSATCRREWEFYARTYACNDADRFAEAERRRRACP